MGRVKTAQDPSIESLLDSIRRAIHDGSGVPEDSPAVKVQPVVAAAAAAKADAADSPRPGKAPPAPLRPVQPQSPGLRPAQAGELAGVKTTLRPVQAIPASQTPAAAGSAREARPIAASAGSGPGALATRTDDFLALRNRLANLSVTRDRLSRTLSGQDNGFAGILGGDVRLEEALARAGGHKVPKPVSYGSSFRDTAPALRSAPMHPASPLDDVVFSQLPPHGPHFTAGYESDAATYDPLGGCDESVPLAEVPSYGYGEPGEADVGTADDYLGNGHESARSWLSARPAHPGRQATVDPSGILSDDASDATAGAFNRLADTLVAQATAGNRSVEEITREVLRPMLKSWLDEHLPRVVERLVREEIGRVARRGGR